MTTEVLPLFSLGLSSFWHHPGCISPPSNWSPIQLVWCVPEDNIEKYLGHTRELRSIWTKKTTTHRDSSEALKWDNRKCYNSVQQMLIRFSSGMFNYFILIRNPGTKHHSALSSLPASSFPKLCSITDQHFHLTLDENNFSWKNSFSSH